MSKVSIIIPTIRPSMASERVREIHANAGIPLHDYEIRVLEDIERIGLPRMVQQLTEESRYDLVCFIADDVQPQPDFLKIALDYMAQFPDGWGLVKFNDQAKESLASHWLAHKQLLKCLEGEAFFHLGYKHNFADAELGDICRELGRFKYAEDARLVNLHPHYTGEEWSEDYNRPFSAEWMRHDRKLYRDRKYARTGNPEIGIGVPLSWPFVHSDFFDSFTQLNKLNGHVIRAASGPIQDMRNSIVHRALMLGCTHLLFIDADMVFPPDMLTRLLAHKKSIIGALTVKRWPPFNPLVYVGEKYEMKLLWPYPDGLVPITATGTGCLLIAMEVFDVVEHPWFEFSWNNGERVGEDIGFCYKAGDAGFQVYVDTSVKTEHITMTRANENLFRLNQELIKHNQGSFNF